MLGFAPTVLVASPVAALVGCAYPPPFQVLTSCCLPHFAADFAQTVVVLCRNTHARRRSSCTGAKAIADDSSLLLRQVSKSALFAVGAPHTWPGLLAALAWLVEMLSYEEKAAAARASSFDDRARRLCALC